MSKADETGAVFRDAKVLVVEDQYLVADDVRRIVQTLGGTVLGPCGDLDQADRALVEHRPDFAVLDVNLGERTVYPLVDKLAALGVPFVLATGYEGWVLPEAYRDRPRLEKPVTARALAEAAVTAGFGAKE